MTTPSIAEGYSYKELKPLVLHAVQRGASVLVKGHPGCGKSTMMAEIAAEMRKDIQKKNKDHEFPFIDIRLASKEPSEICGIQVPNRELKTIEHYRPEWVSVDNPFFLNLDELNSAVTRLHQSVAYQIVLEKRVGPFKFAPGTCVVACGNMEDDNAITTPLSSALNNRFVHFILKPDVDGWVEWASKQGDIAEDLIGYVAFKREKALYNNDGHDAFPSPRSIAMAGRINGVADMSLKRKLVAACIGEAAATEYITFVKIYRDIKLEDIFEKGIIPTLDSSTERSFLYALICSCASYINKTGPAKMKGARAENTVKLLAAMGKQVEYLVIMFRMLRDMSKVIAALNEAPGFKEIALNIANIAEQAV